MNARTLLAAALALLVAGCQGEAARPSPEACGCDPAQPAVDAALLSYLSKARALHRQADIAEARNDRAGAIAALERLLSSPTPQGNRPEVDEVIADGAARLADLLSADARFDDAARRIDQGLERARDTGYFRGHLFEVRGLVEERRAEALKQKGDVAAADKARARALDASAEAVRIQDEVIGKALGAGGAR